MKFSIVSKAAVPDGSLIDPETTLSMDPFLSACTGIDALVHAIEAFVSTGHGPLTDPHALEAMRSEEHTSEIQSLMRTSYAVFCLKKQIDHLSCMATPPPQ